MSDHRRIWDLVRTPPDTALKKIQGGRLAGKSDISPQWRWQVMTETFGPIGFGWRFEQVERWTERGEASEVMAFVRVKLHVFQGGRWSEPIFGTGGAMLIEKERSGLHNNDEAWKMAETDALGNAAKYLGVAADVYLGRFDGSKYRDDEPRGGLAKVGGANPGASDQQRLVTEIAIALKDAVDKKNKAAMKRLGQQVAYAEKSQFLTGDRLALVKDEVRRAWPMVFDEPKEKEAS